MGDVSIQEKPSEKQAKEERRDANFLAQSCQRRLVEALYGKCKGLFFFVSSGVGPCQLPNFILFSQWPKKEIPFSTTNPSSLSCPKKNALLRNNETHGEGGKLL